ncbi:hypothetical protein KC345_g8396 [Hortaea werneckii]|nr:hypothetical protein KC345_g8396 [Hortaea werneckii]
MPVPEVLACLPTTLQYTPLQLPRTTAVESSVLLLEATTSRTPTNTAAQILLLSSARPFPKAAVSTPSSSLYFVLPATSFQTASGEINRLVLPIRARDLGHPFQDPDISVLVMLREAESSNWTMFHNEYNMSSTLTTPSRHQPGFDLPDLDTRLHDPKHATAVSFGGWLTPPQSAHESRRGSLANSLDTDQAFSAHPNGAVSMPATPVHVNNYSHNPLRSQWTQHTSSLATQIQDHFGIQQYQDTLPDPKMAQLCVSPGQDGGLMYSSPQHAASMNDMDSHMDAASSQWMHSHGNAMSSMEDVDLRPALFQDAPHFASNFQYESHAKLGHGLSVDTTTAGPANMYDDTTSNLVQPQLVVPSQLSPGEDWSMVEYPDYCNAQDGTPGLVSATSSFSAFDFPEASTPEADHSMYTEDQGYVMVKPEPLTSPTTSSAYSIMQASPQRTRKQSVKRSGKSNIPRAFWKNQATNCLVYVEGNCHFTKEGRVVVQNKPVLKPHKCHCGNSFERSEHLKRHQKSHSPSRDYPCPLLGCKSKGSARGDNATDHFKTHLKKDIKGRRNQFIEWPELKVKILETYPPDRANKMLGKLEKACKSDPASFASQLIYFDLE